MCVLEHVNVLGDALDFEVVALHFIMQHQLVEGVLAGSPCFEVVKEVIQGNLRVKRVVLS